MQVHTELKKGLLNNSSLALGVFDGIHIGHQKVIRNAVQNALEMGLTSGVVTFSRHPRHIIAKSAPESITSLEDKIQFFKELGVENTVVINFNEPLAKMSAFEYMENILQGCLGVKSISVGYNHKFGHDKKSANDFLKEYCTKNDIKLSVISPVKINAHTVSSSVIRGFITSGDVSSAREFLGRPFKVKGQVIKGEQLGRKMGFPTANLLINEDMILPLSGVYSGTTRVKDKNYASIINIGKKPTIAQFDKDLVETHIFNFDEDIYGEFIEVFFLERIRDEKKFNSIDELKNQIQQDCLKAAQYKV